MREEFLRMLGLIVNSFAIQRSVAAGLSFCALLLGAHVLPVEPYSSILQTMFLAKFLQVVNLGAVSGYFVSRYSKTGVLASEDTISEARFVQTLALQFLLFGAALAFVALFWEGHYLLGVLAFLLLGPIYACEPIFRDRGWFFVSLLPDFLLATVLLTLCWLSGIPSIVNKAPMLFACGLALLVVPIWCLLAWQMQNFKLSLSFMPLSAREMISLLQMGMPVYMGTACFILASSADRLFFPSYGSAAEVARYFLAYQLATGAMMFISAVNFTNVVSLGHAYQDNKKIERSQLYVKLRQAILIAICSVLSLTFSIWLLERLLFDKNVYSGLLQITFILSLGMSVFFIAGTITPVLAYLKRQMPMSLLMGGLAIVLFVNNAVAMWAGLGASWLATITALGFIVYGTIAIFYTLNEAE